MSTREDELARFFDGALADEDAARYEATLAADPALKAEHDAMVFTRDALQGLMRAEVEAADFSGFWQAVEAQLPEAPLPAPREAAPTPATSAGIGERVGAWWRRFWTPVVVSALAAAGVAWFVSARNAGGDEVTGGEIIVEGVQSDGPQTVLISQPEEDGGTTVIWLLDEEHDTDGEHVSPDQEDPI